MQADNEGRLLKEEIELLGPRSPARRFPADVKERVVAWIHARLAAGESGRQLSAFLEIPWETIDKWRGRGAIPSAGEVSGAPPAKGAATLRPVKLVAGAQPKETGGLTLRTPRGYVVEGLDVAGLEQLLSRLG